MALIANLVSSDLFENSKTLINRTTYYGIYCDEGMVVFKVHKRVQKIKDWLAESHQTVDKAVGNQHLQFTAEI